MRARTKLESAPKRRKTTKAPPAGAPLAWNTPLPCPLLPRWLHKERVRVMTTNTTAANLANATSAHSGCVVYWMNRDRRAQDNWALLLAHHLASSVLHLPLRVAFTVPRRRQLQNRMPLRYAQFMLDGIKSVQQDLQCLDIPLDLVLPPADSADSVGVGAALAESVLERGACAVVTDFSPLREQLGWLGEAVAVLDSAKVPLFQVDAHNIVPVWHCSDKREYAARTIRPKLTRKLGEFLKPFPVLVLEDGRTVLHEDGGERGHGDGVRGARGGGTEEEEKKAVKGEKKTTTVKKEKREKKKTPVKAEKKTTGKAEEKTTVKEEENATVKEEEKATVKAEPQAHTQQPVHVDWEECLLALDPDPAVTPVAWAVAGAEAGMGQFRTFLQSKLRRYADNRNDPNHDVSSRMSPWVNHGQVSFQRLALLAREAGRRQKVSVEAYLEEGIVRRELSDNYCFYEPRYDTMDAAAGWARSSLEEHSQDPREYVYSLEQLDAGRTHDDLWNAAQLQQRQEGRMHGFLRMYWAKKVLEWTRSPQEAFDIALHLNDRYALDGRDSNGVVGVAWSVFGIHDNAWMERQVFGKIRYMNYAGCKRKFEVTRFVAKYPPAARNAASAAKAG